MKILLTGATGFLGFRTLEKLAENDQVSRVVATGRTIKNSHAVSHPKIEYLLGDLQDFDFTRQLVQSVDYIIHAAALSSPWGKYAEFEQMNLLPMQNLIRAAHGSPIKRFVYISTPSLYFDAKDRFLIRESEALPDRFINAYAQTKYEAERELVKSGLPHVILRPRALIGRGDTVIMPRLIRAYDEKKLKVIGDGNNTVDLTAVANVVHAIERSLVVEGEGLNQVYNITNGEPVLLWEAIEKVLQLLDKEMNRKKVPYGIVKKVAQFMELKSKLTDYMEPALTVYGVGTLAKSFTMDISKARQLLGYQPQVSINEAIVEFVNWYKNT